MDSSTKIPVVSIVTPSLNQVEFLENTILSVLKQGYPNLEYIVMDGGSTDGSVEIIQKYAKYLRFWQSQSDGGQVNAINAGFRKATGDIFAFLNSDDFLLQGAVQHIVELYKQYPQAVGWVGGGYSIVKDGYIIQTRLPEYVGHDDLGDWKKNWILQPACFFSSRITRKAGLFDPKYHNAFDFDFWMRLSRIGDFIPTPRMIAVAMIRPDTKSLRYQVRFYKEIQAVQRTYGYESFAQATQVLIDQALKQTPLGTAAKLIFETQTQKKKTPDHFVRFPEKLKNI